MAASVDGARQLLRSAATQQRLAPKLLRLAFHDAFTYDSATQTGGANGSIRTERELAHAGNEGLGAALKVIEECKSKCPELSYADLIQLGAAVAVEAMGGPAVRFVPGRRDSRVSPPQGRLPRAEPGVVPKAFTRMGMQPKHWVALVGIHPLGACFGQPNQVEEAWQPLPVGVRLDNTYYKVLLGSRANGGPTVRADPALTSDPALLRLVEAYAADEAAWRAAFAEACELVSVLGTELKAPAAAGGGPSSSRAGATGGSGSGGKGGAGGLLDGRTTLTNSQLAVGTAVVAAVGVAVGYWFGRRRRFRF